MLRLVVLGAALVIGGACGGRRGATATTTTTSPEAHLVSAGDRIVALLPDGAQIVVELDLGRMRANPVVGEVVGRALDGAFGDRLPAGVPRSPLATTSVLVLAAYGVGTSQAATIIVLATTTEVDGGRRIAPDLVVLGPPEWIDQVEARSRIKGAAASPAFLRLRDHAMPAVAPGASLRVTARLPFDARIALARQTGLESAPGQLSIWGDVVDDLAIIVDADAVDPGDRKNTKDVTRRLASLIRGALASLAEEPAIRALGFPPSLLNARLIAEGTWVRAVIAVGPSRLLRAIERAKAVLVEPAPEAPPPDVVPELSGKGKPTS